ncbi:MAG: serine/threonine protein kinase [Myxococcota bacterium]
MLVPADVLRAHPQDDVLGKRIGGKYAVMGILGSGGFGTVYRAIQEPVGRIVAVKIVHKQHARNPDLRARFFREARVVAQLSDPTVVTLYDYGDAPDVGLYTVFEFVDGETLLCRIEQGPQDPFWVSFVLMQLLKALAEAHALGMVHRDIKPENIMIVRRSDGEETVRLLDFGIAKVVASDDRGQTVETKAGMLVGTPKYMSPEQARAKGELDARSDLYSLGVVAYTLLSGANPFARDSFIDTIMAQCTVMPPAFSDDLMIPPGIEEAVFKAIDKDPDRRFQSANEMSEAFRRVFPASSVPSGLTPAPSYAGFRAQSESNLRSPSRSLSREAALRAASGEAAAPSGLREGEGRERSREAALQGGFTVNEEVSKGHSDVRPRSSSSRILVPLLFLLLLIGAGAFVLLSRSESQVEIEPLVRPVPGGDRPRSSPKPKEPPADPVDSNRAEARTGVAPEPEPSDSLDESMVGSASEAPKAIETEPEPTPKDRTSQRSAAAAPRRRASPEKRAVEPKKPTRTEPKAKSVSPAAEAEPAAPPEDPPKPAAIEAKPEPRPSEVEKLEVPEF